MKNLFTTVIRLDAVLILSAFICGCSADETGSGTSASRISFSCVPESFGHAESRSALSSAGMEDMITSISIFIYNEDRLIESGHYEQDFSGMSFNLVTEESYDIYALVNMGDMRASMPSDKSGGSHEQLTWTLPSLQSVSLNGLPMSGVLEDFKAGTDDPVIHLKRLFAKVTVNVGFSYQGASVSSVKVMNLNCRLRPFGQSAALSASHIMTETETDDGSGAYVFYIPENMQGQIGSASASHGKNPDIDPDINAVRDLLTYMEVEVALDGQAGRTGTITYRSYLGNNDTKNFDIKGNCRYEWKVTYMEDDLQYDDWKVDTGDMSSEMNITFGTDPRWDETGSIIL